jgi:hypothetical protein
MWHVALVSLVVPVMPMMFMMFVMVHSHCILLVFSYGALGRSCGVET